MTAVNRKSLFYTLFRAAIVLLACAGLYDTVFSDGSFMNASVLCYYTIQSNILALLVSLAAVVLAVLNVREPGWFRMVRFITAVAILVTFLVFWTMLAYIMQPQYLVTLSNITLHTLVPLMMIADTLFLDRGHIPSKLQVLLCSIPPLCYLAFAMIRAEVSDTLLADGSRYPYWFMDVDKLGWFGLKDGIGVFYWVLVVVAIVLGFGYLFRFIKCRTGKLPRPE